VWAFDPSVREYIRLDPGDVLTAAQARVLLDPLIKPATPFDESRLPGFGTGRVSK